MASARAAADTQRVLRAALIFAGCALFASPARTWQAVEPAPQDERGVRLIVLIAIDQLVPEELERLAPAFRGGLGRFLEEGLVFAQAAHEHGVTETAPGHATLGTGCHPFRHGIVANDWRSRSSGEGWYCFADPAAAPLRAGGPGALAGDGGYGRSPANLRRPALAEMVAAADPRSKSCSIAGKDRAAIGLGGRSSWCLWWDQAHGGFESSSVYGSELPAWVREWNSTWVERLMDGPFGAGWSDDLARAAGPPGEVADERAGEGGRVFPYPLELPSDPPSERDLRRMARFVYESPANDAFVVDLAAEAVRALELGADEHPDVLTISLSSNDVVGHECGPASREITDLLLRADEELGTLFELLDQRAGKGRWIAALSADHGVLPLPEQLAARGLASRRLSGWDVAHAVSPIQHALEKRWGDSLGFSFDAHGVHVSPEAVAAAGLELYGVRAEIAAALQRVSWIERALTLEDLERALAKPEAADELALLSARSFDPDRSPDVTVVCKPWLLAGMRSGTSHGTPHPYDRRVPLCFLGAGFEAGRREERAATVDVAPTLLDRAGVPVPEGLDGAVLAPRATPR